MNHLGELIFSFMDIIMHTAAIFLLLSLLAVGGDYNVNAERKVNEKINVVEIRGEYTDMINTVNPSEVLSEIKSTPDAISIMINSYHVTEEDKKRLKENNDASSLSRKIESNRDYQKKYNYDNNGRIVEIIYQSI